MRKIAIALILTMVAAGVAVATEPTRWLNVTVTEPESNTNVQVHLPMELVLSVLRAVDVENFHAGMVDLELDEADIDWPALLAAVQDAPDGKFVTVTSDDADVAVKKEAGLLHIDVQEKADGHATVKVTMPMAAMSALKINETNQIDVAALIESFRDVPNGELVRVDADDAQVRVWIE